MKVHYGIYDHICYICKKSFTDRSNMNAHMKVHTNDRPCSCDDCGKPFKRKYDITKHKRQQKYPCAEKSQLKKVKSESESDIEEIADNSDIKANENPKTIDESNMANEELIINNHLNNLRLFLNLYFLSHFSNFSRNHTMPK